MRKRSEEELKILAIETTGKYGSAAVIDDDGRVFSAECREEMNHLRGIISLIDEALGKAGITKEELTHIAASTGPGSFTGIRIGVVMARTLSQMLDIPCIAVSSLEALAEDAMPRALHEDIPYIVPIINARRHQTYGAVYEVSNSSDPDDPVLATVMEEKQYMIEELLDAILLRASATDASRRKILSRRGSRHVLTIVKRQRRQSHGMSDARLARSKARMQVTAGRRAILLRASVVFTGDGIDAYKDIIEETLPEGTYIFANEETRYQHAEAVSRIALRKAAAGDTVSYDGLMPEYMRLAEAEQRLRAGTLSDKIRNPKV